VALVAARVRNLSTSRTAKRARQATANRHLTVLKAALNKAFHDGRVATDQPWRSVKPFRNVDAARLRYLSEDECRRLLNACVEDFRHLVRGALISGCRYGELTRMTVADFSIDSGTLLIRQAKSGKPRYVPLDDQAVVFYESTVAGRASAKRMFMTADGRPWGKSYQARPLAAGCEAARIEPPINFHGLRHTWASHRVMKGAPLIVLAQVLGHADTRMVEKHYGHLAPSHIRDVVRATALDLGEHANDKVTTLRRQK
jgi:integrase